jgi:hypothetical protein|tara:strand:- start:701 stop:874 length:174 start_codon:yes stop_codon:yes gene_type:complete
MLDKKNIPVYEYSKGSIKKTTTFRKYIDDYYDKGLKKTDKSFLDNYFGNVYEGDKRK